MHLIRTSVLCPLYHHIEDMNLSLCTVFIQVAWWKLSSSGQNVSQNRVGVTAFGSNRSPEKRKGEDVHAGADAQ